MEKLIEYEEHQEKDPALSEDQMTTVEDWLDVAALSRPFKTQNQEGGIGYTAHVVDIKYRSYKEYKAENGPTVLSECAHGASMLHNLKAYYASSLRLKLITEPRDSTCSLCCCFMNVDYHTRLHHCFRVLFEESFHALDSDTLEQLKELSSKRKAVEDSTNGSAFLAEAIAREMSGGFTSRYQQDLQKLECYLPLLENLIMHVNIIGNTHQMLQWISGLQLQWTSASSAPSIFSLLGPKFFRVDNLQFELGMMLFLYGAILRERALEVLQDDLVQSAAIFRKAAGVYDYLAKVLLPALQPFLPENTPPEVTVDMPLVMSLICLAEAQSVTIRKAEEKASSSSLLAKLHYGVTQLLIEAISILDSKEEDVKNVSDQLLDFVSFSGTLHEARSRKYMAMDLQSSGQVGLAIGIIRHAIKEMTKRLPNEETWRVVFEREANSLGQILQKFEQENEFVWLDKLPHMEGLPFLEGKRIVSVTAYTPSRSEKELVFKI